MREAQALQVLAGSSLLVESPEQPAECDEANAQAGLSFELL